MGSWSKLRLWPIVLMLVWGAPVHGAAISGVVEDAGEPVAESEVMLVNAGNNVVMDNAYTDANGAFLFVVNPGVFNIGVFKSDYATLWRKEIVVRKTDVSVRLEFTPSAFVEDESSSVDDGCD